jgi:serine/threonine protein kinase
MDAQRLIAGRYSLVEPLPGSATGLSWCATDQWSGQPVVIMRVPVSSLEGDELLRARQEIAREVRVLGGLSNDHLARPLDVVLDAGDLWVASEPLPGVTMAAELARRGMVGPPEVARWGRDVADGLAAAHGAGVLHRDLHAGVIGLVPDGRVVVGGFATVVTPEDLCDGVPVHVAPEVAWGAPPSPASDIFALGVMLYQAVEGQGPFPSATDRDRLLAAVREGAVAAPPRAGLLKDPLMRMLDPDPAQRPAALAVADQLGRLCAAPSAVQPAIAWSAAVERSATRVTPDAGPPASARAVQGSGPAAPASYGGPPPWMAPPSGPVIPEQHGSGWLPPDSDPGAAPRQRNRMWWVIVAAVVAVLAIAGGLLVALRPPWMAALPGLSPASLPPPGPIGDPRTADPCSLLTVGSVARFGSATPVPDIGYPQSCAILVEAGAEDVVLRVTLAVAPDRALTGVVERIGDMRIYRYAASKGTCDRTVVFKDLFQVLVDAWAYRGAATDLCAVADVGTQTTVAALSSASLPRRDLDAPPGGLIGLDTCSLLDQTALAQVPGLDATRRRQGFAGWLCLWGQNPAFVVTVPTVKVAVNRTAPLSGQPVLIGGRSAQVLPSGKDDPGRCEVDLVQRSYTGSSGRPRVELLEITVSLGAQQSTDVACRSARTLAEAAAPKLPPAS